MSEPNEESLYEALNKGDLSAFVSLVEAASASLRGKRT